MRCALLVKNGRGSWPCHWLERDAGGEVAMEGGTRGRGCMLEGKGRERRRFAAFRSVSRGGCLSSYCGGFEAREDSLILRVWLQRYI